MWYISCSCLLWLCSVINDTGCKNRSEDISLDNNSRAGERWVNVHISMLFITSAKQPYIVIGADDNNNDDIYHLALCSSSLLRNNGQPLGTWSATIASTLPQMTLVACKYSRNILRPASFPHAISWHPQWAGRSGVMSRKLESHLSYSHLCPVRFSTSLLVTRSFRVIPTIFRKFRWWKTSSFFCMMMLQQFNMRSRSEFSFIIHSINIKMLK